MFNGSLLLSTYPLTITHYVLDLTPSLSSIAEEQFSFKYSPGKLRGNQYKTMMTKEELEEEQRYVGFPLCFNRVSGNLVTQFLLAATRNYLTSHFPGN